MNEEQIMYTTFSAIIVVLVIANVSSFGPGLWPYIAMVLAMLTLALVLVITFADFIIFPFLTGIFGITFQPFRNYRITKGQEAVLKNVGGLYYATGYITANLFAFEFKAERIEENEEERELASPDSWERAIMSISFPFKFHVLSTGLDIQSERDEMEGKRSYLEFQMSRALQSGSANDVVITDLQRKINVVQAKMDRVSQGEKPIATVMYVETTAVGVSEKAALDQLTAQIKQLQIALSSLDVQLLRVVGRELYTLFRFNFMLPDKYEDIAVNFDKQK